MGSASFVHREYKMMKKLLIVVLVAFCFLFLASCSTGDPWPEDLYTRDLYPGTTNTYQVGSAALQYTGGYFQNVYLNGVLLVPGVVVEIDPVFTASPAFGIAALDIAAWNGHPLLTTGTHGVTGTIVGTSDAQSLTRKNLTMLNSVPIYWDNTVGADIEVFELWADDNLHILDAGAHDIFVWQGAGTGQRLFLWPTSSSAISTTKDSPTLDFVANYWDATNKNWEAKITHNMITAGAAPKSRLEFELHGVDILRLENDNDTVKVIADGVLDMTTHNIINVVDPVNAQDAATMNYVDTHPAGVASTITIVDDLATNAVMYPTWVTANVGNLPLKVTSTKLSFNPSTGSLSLSGTLNMNDNFINSIKRINLTDPTELTIAAGVITVTQGYHTVDTQGDAPSDDLDTINGGTIGDLLVLSGANDAREVQLTDAGNIRFQVDSAVEGFSFNSPAGGSGTYYSAGYYNCPAAEASLSNASLTKVYGTANSPYGAHAILVASGAGTTNAGTVSIVVSGASVGEDGIRTSPSSETIVADITTMVVDKYYQTAKVWVGTVTYTLTPAGGAAVFAAKFNYGFAAYDSFDDKLFHITLFEVMGRAGAPDAGFDIQLLHHKPTGWTYSAAAFVPGTTALCSLLTDYTPDNALVANERFKYERNIDTVVAGAADEGFLVKIITTANKAVEFMNISIYADVTQSDFHIKDTNTSIDLIYNGTKWMEN